MKQKSRKDSLNMKQKSENIKNSGKIRILAAGDIHGDSGLAEKLAKKAEKEKVDLVILCGDLIENEENTKNILGPFVRRKEKVLFVPGNHETNATADFLAELYKVKNIHGKTEKHKNIGIFGYGGANIGMFQIDEYDIYKGLKKGFDKIKNLNKKIMVTHVHPSGSKIERFTSFFEGSSGVRKAIEEFKPNILLCSHVHEAEGIEEKIGKTLVINVGRHGKIIDI